MKIGTELLRIHPERWVGVAEVAEEVGFESVWVPEHLLFPKQITDPYPPDPDRPAPIAPHAPVLDSLAILAAMAVRTSRILLCSGVHLLPLRHPIPTARTATTIDILSDGRFVFGVALGWIRAEYESVGLAFGERVGRMEESVAAIRELWRSPDPEFHGRHFDFADIYFEPKPVQRPGPPIILGGESEGALERAVRIGDGWYGGSHESAGAAALLARLDAQLGSAGRDRGSFEVSLGTPLAAPDRDLIRRYEDLGIDRLVVPAWTFSSLRKGQFGEEGNEAMRAYGQEVLSRL